MSSQTFGVTLRTDPLARRIVHLSGFGLLLTGIVLILQLPVDTGWRILLLVIWVGDCGFSHWRLKRGHDQVDCIRLDSDGGIAVGLGDKVTPSRLVSGSIVVRRIAWLRIALPGAGGHGELVLGSRAGGLDWHRFQLLWKLCGNTFGHPRRA